MAQELIIRDGTSPDSANPAATVDATGALKVTTGGTTPAGSLQVTTGSVTPITTLTTATTGTGTTADFGSAVGKIAMVVVVNGTVTGGQVRLQVSHDGTNFTSFIPDVNTTALATGVNHTMYVDGAYRYARAVVSTTVTGGGTVTVTLMGA